MTRIHAAIVAALAVLTIGAASACSEVAEPRTVGLWYAQGQMDGNRFDHCVPPGAVDDWIANDSVYWVPNDQRNWNVDPVAGAAVDTTVPLTLTARPEKGQNSGLQVNVWTQTTLKLNTYCGPDEKTADSPVVKFWQDLGDRYDADTTPGWKTVMGVTVVPALEKAKNALRAYTADELVAGTVTKEAEAAFAKLFTEELLRLTGENFFCGPTFNRLKSDCPSVEVSIKDVDYSDPGVQESRNNKQKALENAAAQVAEANGKVQAAQAQEALYRNAAWMELEKAKLQLQAIQACSANPNCTLVLGVDGQVLMGTK